VARPGRVHPRHPGSGCVVVIVWLIVVYDDNLTERGSTVLAALLGGLVGALATYLGVLRGKPSSDGDH
jgi:ABC-type enterobactin transport system permease subunit